MSGLVDQEREDQRHIRELTALNQDIEKSSLHSNFRDCRPLEPSIFSNSTIAEHHKTSRSLHGGSTLGGAGKKPGKGSLDPSKSLAINKTFQERDSAKRALQDKHLSHAAKVHNLKSTLSHSGTATMRSLRDSENHFGTGIIKTVILPNEEINRLAVEAEELKQYLAA